MAVFGKDIDQTNVVVRTVEQGFSWRLNKEGSLPAVNIET
jgi:hypothetical protein